jgi:hypothetical protein
MSGAFRGEQAGGAGCVGVLVDVPVAHGRKPPEVVGVVIAALGAATDVVGFAAGAGAVGAEPAALASALGA